MAETYFVRRGGRVKGPLTRERLRELRNEDRLRMRDEIAVSADGPWERLRDVHDDVLGEQDTGPGDDEFWREELPAEKPRAAAPVAAATDDRTWPERLREWFEGDGAFRKPFHVGSFLAAALPLAALAVFVGVILVSPALEPERGPVPVASPPPPAAPPEQPAAPVEPPPTPAAGAEDPGKLSPLAPEHDAAIAALLAAWYGAADWQARYRLVVPGEQTRRLMQQLYEGQPAPGTRSWSRGQRLEEGKLVAAARSGQPVLVETRVDGHAHAVYVVFVVDRWRIDWSRSLETLWLAR